MSSSNRELLEELKDLITTPEKVYAVKKLAAAGDYGVGDVLSESATAGTVWKFPVGESGYIEKAIALCSTTAFTWRLRLQLFDDPPTGVLNDNVTSTSVVLADASKYEGSIDFPAMFDDGTGMSETVATNSTYGNLPLPYKTKDGNLYGVLITKDANANEVAGMQLFIILQIRKD